MHVESVGQGAHPPALIYSTNKHVVAVVVVVLVLGLVVVVVISAVVDPTKAAIRGGKLGSLRPLALISSLAAANATADPRNSKIIDPGRISEHTTSRDPSDDSTSVHSFKNWFLFPTMNLLKSPPKVTVNVLRVIPLVVLEVVGLGGV